MTDEATPATPNAESKEDTTPAAAEPVTAVPAESAPAAPQPIAPSAAGKKKPATTFIWGTGRRKRAIARVRIRPGDGKFVINKREVEHYFALEKDRLVVRVPLDVTETGKNLDVFVNVGGGGTSGQAGAVLLGLARALAKYDPDFGPKLKEYNLLSRDARKVERKKPGQPGARKRFQFSKR